MDVKNQPIIKAQTTSSQVQPHTNPPESSGSVSEDEMLDTWTFAGKTLKAPEMHMPEPFAAAFKPTNSPPSKSAPYAYDRSQLSVRAVAGGDDEFYIDISLYGGDCIAAVTPLKEDFKIELVNAKDGKYPITEEQLLKAVYAAKLEIEASPPIDE